jgi:hypothetical protein
VTPDADQSAYILTGMLRARDPFYFIKLGDGAIECVNGYGRGTCDGERYSKELGVELERSWRALASHPNLCVGDWMTAAFDARTERTRYADEYGRLMAHAVSTRWLAFDALLLMRETDALLGFYRAVQDDPRPKLLMGPREWEPLAELLKCGFLGLPVVPNLFEHRTRIADLLRSRDFDVLLYGAGLAGHIPVIDCWKMFPRRTYVNIGSALDPACMRGRTRSQQITPNRARAFLNRLAYEVITANDRRCQLLKAHDCVRKLGLPSAERVI